MRTSTLHLPHYGIGVAIAVSCCCCVVQPAFGFQQRSHQVIGVPRTESKAFQPTFTEQQQQRIHDSLDLGIMTKGSSKTSSSSLHAFMPPNSNMGGFGGFGGTDLGPVDFRDWKDVLKRLQTLTFAIIRQFVSGFMNGYVLALIWGIFRPPNVGINRGMMWGLDFGVFSSLFGGGNLITSLFYSTTTNDNDSNDSSQQTSTNTAKLSLWTVTVRNMLLAVYFASKDIGGSVFKMIRSAVFYGGLTYYFIGKKQKRDAMMPPSARMDMMNSMFGGNMNGSMFGGGASSSSAQQMAAMQELIQRLQQQSSTSSSTISSFSTNINETTPQSSSSSSSTKQRKKRSSASSPAPPAKDVVDVEFEKVDKTDDKNSTSE